MELWTGMSYIWSSDMELWTGMSYGISVWSSEEAWVIYGVPIWSSEQARVMGFRYGALHRHELWDFDMELWTGTSYEEFWWSSEQAWVMGFQYGALNRHELWGVLMWNFEQVYYELAMAVYWMKTLVHWSLYVWKEPTSYHEKVHLPQCLEIFSSVFHFQSVLLELSNARLL